MRPAALLGAGQPMQHFVIGGGIAGVCCAEELCAQRPGDQVTLVSASTVLKGVTNVVSITQHAEEFQVVERRLEDLALPNLTAVAGCVTGIDLEAQVVQLDDGRRLPYDRLCIAAGARPKELLPGCRHVTTVRDTQSVEALAARLAAGARRVVVAGNGGIALELVGALQGVEVVWLLKQGHIGDAFFDLDAAAFLLTELRLQQQEQQHQTGPAQQQHQQQRQEQQGQQQGQDGGERGAPVAATSSTHGGGAMLGHAAGPKWTDGLPGRGGVAAHVRLEAHARVAAVSDAPPPGQAAASAAGGVGAGAAAGGEQWPLWVTLEDGRSLGADLVVGAVGVEPAISWAPAELVRAADGGLLVDARLQTSRPGVYAAGDCATVGPAQQAPHWFQMRLWTQARLMGVAAARHMAGVAEDDHAGVNFDLFTHVTRFLGLKVVLLGLYNGQKLGGEPAGDVALYSRVTGRAAAAAADDGDTGQAADPQPGGGSSGGGGTPGSAAPAAGSAAAPVPGPSTFVRLLLLRGRLQGAVLVGDTDLEEVAENLILDGLDLSGYGPALLDPDMELDHVFD